MVFGVRQMISFELFLKERKNLFLSTTTILHYYPMTTGSQGSTLGTLLFLLYIHGLPSSVNCTPRLFAVLAYCFLPRTHLNYTLI